MPTKASSKKRRAQSAKPAMKRLHGADVAITPYDPATGSDTEECFLPLLLLGLGLWGGSRAMRGRTGGFGMPGMGMGGWPGAGMNPGPGAGVGAGGGWGGPWGSMMMRRGMGGMGGWPFSGMGGANGMGGMRSPFWF